MVLEYSNDGPINMQNPVVSIVLPVYNGGKYLEASIRSILDQTFHDFELIIINDGSKDNSESIIRKFDDQRIRYFYNENQGLGKSLIQGVGMAKGEFIARQDADDISLPLRLERQVGFLNQHSDVALVGTWADIIDERDQFLDRSHKHPTDPKILKFELVFNNPFVHSSVMFRSAQIHAVGGYAPERNAFEDYDLWSRVSHHYQVANLPEKLLIYREVSTGISKSNPNYDEWVIYITSKNIQYYLPELDESKCKELAQIYHGKRSAQLKISDSEIENFIRRIASVVLVNETEKVKMDLMRHQIFTMKRKYYNSCIYSDLTTSFQKFIFRIRRKLLFLNNPNTIHT